MTHRFISYIMLKKVNEEMTGCHFVKLIFLQITGFKGMSKVDLLTDYIYFV